MQRRMLGGLLGAMIGAAMGVPLVLLTRVASTPTFTMLLAMAVAATVFALVRRPPWRQASAVESLLRVLAGLAFGAAFAALALRFAPWTLLFSVPPFVERVGWLEHPGLFGPLVGLVTGVLVGLEPSPPKVRVPAPSGRDPQGAI